MSPASGDAAFDFGLGILKTILVSIQLMSPASGDASLEFPYLPKGGFHSINVPSEWGPLKEQRKQKARVKSFHSINVPSEWGLPHQAPALGKALKFPFN